MKTLEIIPVGLAFCVLDLSRGEGIWHWKTSRLVDADWSGAADSPSAYTEVG